VVQIAGLIARRIICGLAVGDETRQGQRYGMICFGSRLDVFLPPGARLNCQIGEKVQAGTGILGYLK
jgi:phosphatidylserine decarboxylase